MNIMTTIQAVMLLYQQRDVPQTFRVKQTHEQTYSFSKVDGWGNMSQIAVERL